MLTQNPVLARGDRPTLLTSARLLGQALVSMRLAVHLLLFLAIASIIGTVLVQQEPAQQYLQQLGPFWFRVFGQLDLYDVYRCAWYIGLVAFLVLSTSSCVLRNSPSMLKEMIKTKRHGNPAFLRSRPEQARLPKKIAPESLQTILKERGYHCSFAGTADNGQLFAQKGRFYRLGYLFTHVAIILFCAGALYNANLPLKAAQWFGSLHPLHNFSLPLSKIPPRDWLPANESAFRGIISIPTGQSVNAVFELVGDGFLVQRLPFLVRLDQFQIRHYRDGIAKSFISHLSIYNHQGQLIKTGIAEPNHPLTVDGVSIFQTSFNDQRSRLTFSSHSLLDPTLPPSLFQARVGQHLQAGGSSSYSLQIEKLKINNTIPRTDLGLPEKPGKSMINVGPIVHYRVLGPDGHGAWSYRSYLDPVSEHGQGFRLLAYGKEGSSLRQYLAIPLGPHGGVHLFLDYLGALERAAQRGANASPATFHRVLQQVMAKHNDQEQGPNASRFLAASLVTLRDLHQYPLPFLISFTHLDLHWSAGLEMTKDPGMPIVYGSSMLLVIGIFILFYVPRKRLWLWPENQDHWRLSGDSSRNPEDFHQEFLDIVAEQKT